MDDQTKNTIQMMIDASIKKAISFPAKKLGDTPTDLRQLVPKSFLEDFYFALAGGTLDEGANIELGIITGTKIGTATNQKLGFYNKAPIVQPTNTAGNVTASGTYGSNEQKMLNDSYTTLRALGLLS